MRHLLRITAIALAAGPAFAAEPVQQQNSNAVWFENWTGLSNATLKVAAPDGTISEIFAARGTPVFRLDPGAAADGVWRYELTAATEETRAIVNPIDNGRGDAARDEVAVSFHHSGHFVVERGVIVRPEEVVEGGADSDG